MNVFIVNGSPRKEGNSAFIAKALLEKYPDATLLNLNEMNYKGCQSCYTCRKENTFCVVNDDLKNVFESLAEADLIILISPNYYGFVTGQMKLFLDRWYCLKDANRMSKMKKGAKLFFVVTQGAQNRDYASNTTSWAKKVFESFNLKFYSYIVPGCKSDSLDMVKMKIDDLKMHLNMFV
ncbi:flavodoxin family protein [Deferribacter autotrophicus]|uniref:Flavodoxin family protein n=1 Tax=Deferribacter autotrophicus TaxID=500465 RepID=A0A5A8F5B4_9BACT|nr:flavodoxin family protein [Deferribacter autotrophicus]KAA0258880.1 flavodoxin family protein [Deferribacter autotrophicus]